jgi:hypothetical protein
MVCSLGCSLQVQAVPAEQRELSPFTVKRQAPFSQAKRYAVGWNADALNAGRNARAT